MTSCSRIKFHYLNVKSGKFTNRNLLKLSVFWCLSQIMSRLSNGLGTEAQFYTQNAHEITRNFLKNMQTCSVKKPHNLDLLMSLIIYSQKTVFCSCFSGKIAKNCTHFSTIPCQLFRTARNSKFSDIISFNFCLQDSKNHDVN